MIAGQFRGRRLASARTRGTRPTADRVREALFSILGADVEGARVLDLYAGTGALALEALSRGARSATCVERSRSALQALERNVRELGLEDRVTVVRGDALAFARGLVAEPDRFELVFCDPPYDDPAEPIVEALGAGTWWTTAAVLEHPSARAPEPPAGFDADTRRYGDTGVTILHRPAGTA